MTLHLFFIFVLVVCISLNIYIFNENSESGHGGNKGWPTNKKQGMCSSLVGEKVTTLGKERKERMGSVIGTEPRHVWVKEGKGLIHGINPNRIFVWRKENKGVDPWDQPQSRLLIWSEKMSEKWKWKGDQWDHKGTPFSFSKFWSTKEKVSEEIVSEWVKWWVGE